jgi:microsomal dipeptidase-like Zn-dependent dipeptidase
MVSKFFAFASLFFLSSVVAVAQKTYAHTTSSSNLVGHYTLIDVEGLNNNPKALLYVLPSNDVKTKNPHPIGVWYTGSKWSIFNQDKAAMPAGIQFSIQVYPAPAATQFVHVTSAANTKGGISYIDNSFLNNNPSAVIQLTQNWNPGGQGGVYNNSEVAIQYDKTVSKWYIYNSNKTQLLSGTSFNVLINEKSNAVASQPVISNPVINNSNIAVNPNAIQALTQPNFNFENGLIGWTATGTAFNNQPVQGNTVMSERVLRQMEYNNGGIGGDYWKGMVYPIGMKGNEWIGTYENGNGDEPVGTLTSSAFKTKGRYLNFLMGGGKDINRLYIELQIKKSDYESAWGVGKRGFFGDTNDGFTKVNRLTPLLNSEDLFRYWFDLDAEFNHQYQNKTIRICIVDNATGNWGHINIDDIQQTEAVKDFISTQRGGFGLFADKDKPVWGFADTHAHWVNNVGLNGLMHGTPGYNWRTSDVRIDIPPCDGFNHGLPTITPGMLIAQTEKAALNRAPERIADPGNSLCLASVVATAAIFWPSGAATVGGAATGAGIGLIGSGISEAKALTGTLDGAITGFLYGASTNPAFQACGYLFVKDVVAKHYNNNIPANNTAISNYIDFPRWNSFFHQMMHITWVRRSYEGGQRLMVVPVGTAKSWEYATTTDGHMAPAKENIEKGIAELKRIVAANSDWMQIALTPQQAREIVLNNKMAIIIGIEQGEIGSYFNSVIDEVTWLEQQGIRHVFPIHNIDNNLGGAAVFNSALNSYNDLVRRSSNDGPITAFKVREGNGNSNDETRTAIKLDRTFMRQNFRLLPIAGFGNIPFFYLNDVPSDYTYDAFTFHKNAAGLQNTGRQYIKELMKRGMIIDLDHMSDLSQNETVTMMKAYQYPMVAGHANFRDLRRNSNETSGDNKEAKLRTEFTIFDSRADDIVNSGGMFGLMNQQNDINTAKDCPVINNASGGTPSFAQAYWYAYQKTKGQYGIAFGSDFNGFAPQTAPRFGVDADFYLEKDDIRNVRCDGNRDEDKLRRCNAFAQVRGVRYDVPIKTYHYHRFLKPAFLTSEEREIWEAIAIAKSGTQPSAAWQPGGGLSVDRTGLQQDKIHNMAEGFKAQMTGDFLRFLDCPEYILRIGNDCMAERKAAFMAVHGEESVPPSMRDARTNDLYKVIRRIYNLWMQFENGPNEPLRRSFAYAGGRDFDFNLDGLAHYGMYPDMIQDLKNLGLNATQLSPLFMSAEQYIRMWEKADAAKRNVRD